MGVKLIIFVKRKNYLSIEQIKELYKQANYLKIQLLLIEAKESMRLPEESWIVNSKLNNFFKVIHPELNWC